MKQTDRKRLQGIVDALWRTFDFLRPDDLRKLARGKSPLQFGDDLRTLRRFGIVESKPPKHHLWRTSPPTASSVCVCGHKASQHRSRNQGRMWCGPCEPCARVKRRECEGFIWPLPAD